jgi:tRNA 2-thiouridine synthesizing protein B
MILHIINKSPYQSNIFNNCLEMIQHSSTMNNLLLIEEAVIAGIENTLYANNLQKLVNMQIYILANDLKARGLDTKIPSAFKPIDHKQFVQLVIEHEKTVSW